MTNVTLRPAQAASPGLWQPSTGPFALGLGEYLVRSQQLRTSADYDRVRTEASRILGQALPPGTPAGSRTGVVIGYVQSGKTMSMATVASLARDNQFRLFIAISGTTENLGKQSRDRFQRDLRGGAGAGGSWEMWWNPTQVRARDLQRFVTDWRDPRLDEQDRPALFISVMKNHSHLNNLAQLLASANLNGLNALIIDDETDQASLNTRPTGPTASTTHQRLQALRQALPKHTYLQYTATAQAVFLISLLDMLTPEFADILQPGEDYTGGSAFFIERNDLVDSIPSSDLPANVTGTLDPPPSLVKALRFYFLGVAAETMKPAHERLDSHRSMLVHPDRLRDVHPPYQDWIERIQARWADIFRRDDTDQEREELVGEFTEAYESLQRSTNGALPALADLCRRMAVDLGRVRVTVVNSDTGSEVEWDNAFAHILVGGEKLSRGYTVKGLTVTYMPRGPGTWTADTVQQRARFFGYKRKYLGFCRVLLHSDVEDIYREYVEHEEHLREAVLAHRGRPTRDLRRTFVLDSRFQPTRRNVLSEPFFRIQTGASRWFKQSEPHITERLDDNRGLVRKFLEQVPFKPHPKHDQVKVGDMVPLTSLLALLNEYSFSPEEALEAYPLLWAIRRFSAENASAGARILLMGKDVRERSLRADDSTINIHQGASSAGSDSYPGDAAIREDTGVTLQVSWIRVVRDGDKAVLADSVPALAVYLGRDIAPTDWIIQPKT